MSWRHIGVRLPADLARLLESRCEASGLSISEFIRDAVRSELGLSVDVHADRAEARRKIFAQGMQRLNKAVPP
jgi:metal-responsive CopG/Arc/MetJ family transcriptional regulator